MTTPYQQVKEFMTVMEQERPDKHIVPSLEIRKLRAKLILEEALETVKALGFAVIETAREIQTKNLFLEDIYEYDPIEVLDGLCDSEYVGFAGTAIACGFSEELMLEAFAEVHRSNMSKMWKDDEVQNIHPNFTVPEAEIGDGGWWVTKFNGRQYYIKVAPNTWLVKNSDNKVVKSPSYSPANLKPILEKYAKA